ncbi:MAG: aspartate aminotransferase family protein [Candidatus Glassbacteria bacterium]|nr:aspartate aminotransferase family protein [Candidatus Glassbacteria bacterium]
MANTFSTTPKTVPEVSTANRTIKTRIPVPESLPVIDKLRKYEPISMSGQPLVLWNKGEGATVCDSWGNRWIDWSSGVLITNAGHNNPRIRQAIIDQAESGLLTSYCFPNNPRARLAELLVEITPKELTKAFILTTGSETVECCLKLMRTNGLRKHGKDKITIVSFTNAFHGRTLGAQQLGGIPKLKDWIVNTDPNIVQVAFPDGFRNPDTSFAGFEKALAEQGVTPESVAGVILETYQGGGASFAPVEYIMALREWCDKHGALLTFDDVQAGFGRCGKMFGFEHYGVIPDLTCFGKGISSSLPVSAVLGREEVMNLYGPNEMTSTHTGNPVCAMAAVANIGSIIDDKLVENAAAMGQVLLDALAGLMTKYDSVIGAVHGKGLVAGVHVVKPGGIEPDADLAWHVVNSCVEKGLLMFAPVGFGGGTVKICPPLVINRDQVEEGLAVLDEAFEENL